ncbi:hypothetical protein ACODYM_29025 [Burkholderia gladioli]|uniref:hypothetical protein n=1 Tax=Burkholderia gladioli TaxID=28095 RepID=UPI003B502D8A
MSANIKQKSIVIRAGEVSSGMEPDFSLLGYLENELENHGIAAVIREVPGDVLAFHDAAGAMVRMLEEREWAEHAATFTGSGDELAQRLESAITDLHNDAHALRDTLNDALTMVSDLLHGYAERDLHMTPEALVEKAKLLGVDISEG